METTTERDADACSLASVVSVSASCSSFAEGVTITPGQNDSELVSNFSALLSGHDGSSSEAAYLQKLWPAPKKLCLLGELTVDTVPTCLRTLGLPFEENFLQNGKLPPNSSGVLIFVTDEFESSTVSYLNDQMVEQANLLAVSLACPVLESPGVIRLVSVKVVEELSARMTSPEDIVKEIVGFKRPVFTLALHKTRFAVTGFTNKDMVRYVTKLVHRMGGSVQQDTDSTTTHLIAKKASGPKYKYCKMFNVPILKKEWIEELWEAAKNGKESEIRMDDYVCPLFHELRVGFWGFGQEKLSEIKACLEQNGGKMVRVDADRVDYIVVNEAAMHDAVLPPSNPKAALVTESWFWESVVKGTVLMEEFRYKPSRPDMSCKSPSVESNRSGDLPATTGLGLPGSTKARRRSFLNLKSDKRRKDDVGRSPVKPDITVDSDSTLTAEDRTEVEAVDALSSTQSRSMGKLASKKSLLANGDQSVGSVGDINLTSESVGSMDHSSSSLLGPTSANGDSGGAAPPRLPTARRQVFCELLQTERNYVMVLDLIMKAGTDWKRQETEASAKKRQQLAPSQSQNQTVVAESGFKVPGAVSHVTGGKDRDSVSGTGVHHGTLHQSLLDNSSSDCGEREQMFDSRILDKLLANVIPLQKIHGRLLAALQALDVCWDENARVGAAIVDELGKHDVIHAYKIYVKDVDLQKSQLRGLSDKYPRFHAYLRAIALKPEYKRQSLDELLIRPVQRLPSMMLLLKDLRKRTPPHLHDYSELNRALEIVDMTTSKINEERRIFDQQREILLKMYEIEDCPPDLLSWSAGRSLISDYDIVDLNNATGKKGSPLVLFFFTDVLLICKRRSGKIGAGMLRSSPSVNSLVSDSGIDGVVRDGQKPYKFICCLELRYVKALLDLRYGGKDQDLHNLVQEGSFGLCIQRDGEVNQTNYAFHVFRGGSSGGGSGPPPHSPSVTLERNVPPSCAANLGGGLNGAAGIPNGLAASGALGSTLSLSEIAVSKSEGPKQELLRLLTENVVRQTFQDPSCLIMSADVAQVNVDPHQYPRLLSHASGNSSNPFHRMTRKMSFRTGSSSSSSGGPGAGGGPTTPLKRSYSTITPSSAGPAFGSGVGGVGHHGYHGHAPSGPKQPAEFSVSSLKKQNTATDGRDEREEFIAPLPPSNSFAKPSPFKKSSNSGSSLRKQFSKFTQFAFSRTTSSSSNSSAASPTPSVTSSPAAT